MAELICGRVARATVRTEALDPGTAFAAELHLLRIVMTTLRAPHDAAPHRGGESPAQKKRDTARSLVTILAIHTLPVVQRLRLMHPNHMRRPGIHRWSHVHQAAFRVYTPIDQQRRAAVQHILCIDFLLQQYQPLKHRLWARWAASDIDVDRDNTVDALHGRIVAIEPT